MATGGEAGKVFKGLPGSEAFGGLSPGHHDTPAPQLIFIHAARGSSRLARLGSYQSKPRGANGGNRPHGLNGVAKPPTLKQRRSP